MAKPLSVGLSMLQKCMTQHQGNESLQLAEEICEYFERNLSCAELDLAINDAFLSSNSLLTSLKKSLGQRKIHKNANIKILELITNLIEKYRPKIDQYAKAVVETMVLYYLSSNASAKERENVISIMQNLVKNDLCKDVDMTELLFHLLKIKNEKKPTAKVLQLTYELLGLIAQEYPESLLNGYDIQIRDLFFQTLETTLHNQQEYSFLSLCGALNGFTYFLTNFAPCPDTHPMICQRIYACVFKLSDPGDIKDKMAFRASLNLIEKHAFLFSAQLYRDHSYWHKTLLNWMALANWTDRKSAIATLYVFHQELSRQLENRNTETDLNVLRFYINFFKSILQSKDSRPYEIRISIRGFGVFSKVCKHLLPNDHLLDIVMLRTEYTSIDNTKNKDVLEHYPEFVQALSEIMEHTEQLSEIQISSLQNIIIELMKNFYLLSRAHHELVVSSLLKAFKNLSKLGTILDDVLEKVIMQGVIWACSHQIKLTANTDWETQKDWKEHITYDNFIQLWLGLLAYSEDIEQFTIKERIYSHFVTALFVVIDKLNLSTKKRVFKDSNGHDQELYFCNPNLDLVPLKPKDFHIFINVVDFYRDVLMQQDTKSHINFFAKFVNQFLKKIIVKAFEHPLVSGFLKLLEVVFWIWNKLSTNNLLIREVEEQNIINLRSFIRSLIPMTLQTFGELQIACLRLIFTLPIFMLKEFSENLVPVFQTGFDIGRSVHFMASITLTALERLTVSLKENEVEKLSRLLKDVLPYLNTYLQSNDLQNESKIDIKIVEFRKRKLAKKVFKMTDADSELLQLQKRIVLYLGTLEPRNCIQMIESDLEKQVLTKSTSEQNIRVKLYYPQLTPTIFLDTFVSRICYLATSSSNRKTKIAACELTHAIVLYLIGTGHYEGDLWKKLCEDILTLGSDGDDAVKQMFEPMLMQMIHYMTQRSQILHPGVEIFCEQLMEGISHKSSSAIRDLSARCLREFVKWNIKELTSNLTTEIGALPILKKLKLYSFDSDNNKRCGAALAFNNLYRIIREENNLINEYWLDLLHTFSINFIMSEEFGGDSECTYNEISTCLDHIVRVIFERKDSFNLANEKRVTPTDFCGNSLKDAMIWLFQQCGSKQINYRRKCQQIFMKLTPCVKGYNSVLEFLRNTQNVNTLLEVLEGPSNGVGIAGRPNLRHIEQDNFLTSLHSWLQHLLCSIDCHIWIMGNGLFQDPMFNEKSNLLEALTVFMNQICFQSLSDIFKTVKTEIDGSPEKLLYSMPNLKIISIKREIIVRLIDYFTKMIPSSSFPVSFWTTIGDSLIQLVIKIIFEPNIFGFNLKGKKFTASIQSRVISLIEMIKTKSMLGNSLIAKISDEFIKHYKNLVEFAEQQLHLNGITMEHYSTVEGIKILVKSFNSLGFPLQVTDYVNGSVRQLIVDLFNGIIEKRQQGFYARNILPDIRDYANNIMRIALSIQDVTQELALFLCNQSQLIQSGEFGTIAYGSHFIDVFRSSLYEYYLENPENSIMSLINKITPTNIQHICRILIHLTQFIYKWRKYDGNNLKSIVRNLLNIWTRIGDVSSQDTYSPVTTLSMIDLMVHIALIYPYPLHEISVRTNKLETWITNILSDAEKSLELKARVISLIPCVIGPLDNEQLNIQRALENLQLKHFPLHSNEFPVGSLERSGYVNALESILQSMVASRSVVLLRFVINVTAPDSKHILEFSIQQHLESFINKQSPAQQHHCLNIPFHLFCDPSLEPTIRLSIMKRFLLKMIKHCYVEGLLLFYANHIKQIDGMLRTHYGLASCGWAVEQALTNRIGAFQLVEALLGAVPKEKLVDKSNPILLSYMGADKQLNGNELIRDLTKKAKSTRSDIFVTDDTAAKELYRKYQSASFNAMCAILCNTQTRLEFYDRLLFKENPSKNDYIWRNIIDQNNDLYTSTFTQEYDDFPKIKQRIVSIRRIDAENDQVQQRYMKSQTIFDSSLSQDITKLDLSSSSVRTDAEVAGLETTSPTLTVMFEKNLITDHESMAVLCAVYAHMFEQNITPIAENLLARQKTPDWVRGIADLVADSRQHKNIRLFLAKSVEICRSNFIHYAHALTRPVLQLLVDECAGSSMCSFVIDLIVMLLEWKNNYQISSYEEIELVSSLLEFLMKNAWNAKKEIFKQNLEIIKHVIEQWRDVVSLKKQFLFDSINRTTQTNSRDNICGLQLNAIVLANNLIPWTDTSRDDYLRSLLQCLKNELTACYQPAAQILGMSFAIIQPNDEDACFHMLHTFLLKLKEERKIKEFVDILYGVHKGYPRIVDKFFMSIGKYISLLSGTPKRICLEMFFSRMDYYESEICQEIQAISVAKLLKIKDYQLLALHIINKALPKMKAEDVFLFMDDICEFVDSNVVECRDIMYEILMFICQTFTDGELAKRSSSILLNGLIDSNSEIQTRLFNFWSNPERLPNKIENRFLHLFEKLFDEQSEKNFLNYCTQLLLEPAIQNPDSKRQVFEHQIDNESKLKEYEIDVSWKTQNSLIKAPLFVETNQPDEFSDYLISTQHIIRATNTDLAFEPTKDPTTMSQTSDIFSFQSASSFLFSQQPLTLDRRSRRVNPADTSQSFNNDTKIFSNLRHRIVTDKDKTSRSYALAAIERNSYTMTVRSEEKQRKEQHVQLYRRYRYGEYPDLLINSLALLLPLKGLVKRDKILARQLLVSIFSALVKELGPQSSQFIIAISQSIENIFVKTKNNEPLVFAALMEIVLHSNANVFKLPIDIVTMLSMANNMMPIGILYIENVLNYSSDACSSRAEKLSNSSIDNEEDHWLKLSKMYRNLTEHDIVAGIFADKLNMNDDKITRAIELEQNNDHLNAQKIYLDVILRQNKVELDFCYEAYYKCFEYLSDWSTLSTTLQQQYESYDELWSDEWNLENILPLVIKSELRLILNGNTENRQEFLNEMKNWLLMSDRADYMKINFGEELMMFHIANSDYLSARVHSEQHFTAFISDWFTLNSMSHKIRSKKLLNVRNVSEIHKYSKLLSNMNAEFEEVDRFCQLWKHSNPQPFDSIILWDAITTYRIFVGEILKFSTTDEEVKKNISDSITDITFKLLDLTLNQKNLKLSDVLFDKLQLYEHQSNDPLCIDWHIAKSIQNLLKGDKTSLPMDKLEFYCNAWIQLNENVLKNALTEHAGKHITALRYVSDISMSISNFLSTNNISNDILEGLLISNSMWSHRDNKVERLNEHSYFCLEKCIGIATENLSHYKHQNAVKLLGDSYLKLFDYAQTHQDKNLHVVNNIDEIMIRSLLRAMANGSKEARQYFPRLLQIENLSTDETKNLFNEESSQVPAWMFLGWISQIISELKYDRNCFIDELILRLAKNYPSAIIYPLKLSYSQYIQSQLEAKDDRPLIVMVNDIIHNPIIDHFTKGLLSVCIPYKMLYYHLSTLQMEFSLLSENQYGKRVTNILDTVFPTDRSHFGKEFEKLLPFTDSIKHLSTLSVIYDRADITNALKKMITKLKYVQAENTELVAYSPWLARFQWCGEENNIELPGQYTGDSYPIISNHIKIIKFDEKLTIFPSLRMPIKLKIYCSNGKSYSYLVKYGEDMRQDERIQQIFLHMSEQLQSDERCLSHQLNIKGYRVIPINEFCGILSFVEKTKSINDIVRYGLQKKEGSEQKIDNCRQEFLRFIKVPSIGEKVQNTLHLYGRSILRYSRTQIINNLRKLEYDIPEDIIKYALIDLSVSPESFFVLRNNFITSLATMNIAHWILGIGDRHLSNILMNTKNGCVLGIDFNLAFGAGTMNSRVPELLPFRLTPHFVNVVNPLGTTGLTKIMVHTLRVFRSSKKLLTSYMASFVKEPTIDWLQSARSRNPDDSISSSNWEPAIRIRIASGKLSGANPKDIFAEELSVGQVRNFPDYMNGYLNLLNGHQQHNIRARLLKKKLTVEEQVQCLIDMATDPALLGVTYYGFQPWI